METILEWSAWTMNQPKPYGIFHLCMLFIGIPISIFLAYHTRKLSLQTHHKLLFLLGLLLILSEIYKQLFHFYISDHHTYDWWIFPFQLCSLPMYLSIWIPFLQKPSNQRKTEAWLMDICLLGGFMALLFPSGMMHSYVILTMHSFLWHFILLFIGFHIAFSRTADTSYSSFSFVSVWFLISASIATCFNILFHTYGDINMFYINPYQPISQPVFKSFEPILGRIPVIICYLICLLLGLFIVHTLVHAITKKIDP